MVLDAGPSRVRASCRRDMKLIAATHAALRHAGIDFAVRLPGAISCPWNKALDADGVMAAAAVEKGSFFIVASIDRADMRAVDKAGAMPFDIVGSTIRFRRTLEDKGWLCRPGRSDPTRSRFRPQSSRTRLMPWWEATCIS